MYEIQITLFYRLMSRKRVWVSTRSSGDISICRPRRLALMKIVSKFWAEKSMMVVVFFRPSGLISAVPHLQI